MSAFEPALAVVLEHEGFVFTTDPQDPGGATRWGITIGTLRRVKSWATPEDVAALTRDEAAAIYRTLWWDAIGIGRIVDQQVATKTFDTTVHVGTRKGVQLLQGAVNACEDPAASAPRLAEDGILGDKTVAAVNSCTPREVLLEYGFHQLHYYHRLIDANPNLEKYRKGWVLRASWPYTGRSAVFA